MYSPHLTSNYAPSPWGCGLHVNYVCFFSIRDFSLSPIDGSIFLLSHICISMDSMVLTLCPEL